MMSSWRSHLGIVAVDLLHQVPARTVEDPFIAYVPGEVTQNIFVTNEDFPNHPRIDTLELFNWKIPGTMGHRYTAYVPRKVTQVSRMTDVHPKFPEKSPRYRGCRPVAPGIPESYVRSTCYK